MGGGVRGGGRGRVGGGRGVRVDVNEELKFFVKIPKKTFGGGGGSGLGGGQDGCERRIEAIVKIQKKNGGVRGGSALGGGGGGVRVDVNEELKFL